MINFDFKSTNYFENNYLDFDACNTKLNEYDMIGWTNSISINPDIDKIVTKVKRNSSVLVVVGIGGSYLGSKAIHDALSYYFEDKFEVIYCGYSLSNNYLTDLLNYLENKDFSVDIISKSGNTMEIKLAYNMLLDYMKTRYSDEEISERIFATTGTSGFLYNEAIKHNYFRFNIPEDFGGRFSMMSDAHLFPLAFNININKFVQGYNEFNELEKSFEYAGTRVSMFDNKKYVENFVSFEPKYGMFLEWIKQLFGESEGKDGKGVLPFSTIFTRDLHSLGQFIQEGNKILFETFIVVRNNNDLKIGSHDMNEVNNKIVDAVREAHYKGNVSINMIELDEANEYNFGYLVKFLMYAAAYSGILFNINPFDQPGVEVYKKEIRKRLNEE